MTCSEAIKKFKSWRTFKVGQATVKGYDLYLRQFCLYIHNKQIEAVQLEDIISWFELMRELEWDQNSLMPKAQALKKLFEFLRKIELRVLDPWLIPIPDREVKLPRVLTEENYQKLLATIPENNDPRHVRNRALINMYWDTGARNSEILALDIDDLDLEGMRAVIKTEKNKGSRRFREIFWTPGTNQAIKNWLARREIMTSKKPMADQSAVFISTCGLKIGHRFDKKGVGEMLRRYSHKAGIPIVNAHSFRHHMGHDIIKQGGSAADVMNILGHATLASSTIYTMMTNRELEERYRRFKPGVP